MGWAKMGSKEAKAGAWDNYQQDRHLNTEYGYPHILLHGGYSQRDVEEVGGTLRLQSEYKGEEERKSEIPNSSVALILSCSWYG